jgi:hypothetical protein
MNGSYEERIDRIKSVACRSANKGNFNSISLTKLRTIYNTFRVINKTTEKTMEAAYECLR